MKFTDIWSINPCARPEAVITGNGYRITVLTDRLLRLEYDADNVFCDTATQTAICREFPAVKFSVTDADGLLTVETDAVRLEYDKQPFSGTGLRATLKGQFSVYASIWHYGDKPDTLKGTARTLDEANGAIELEEGLMSMKGYAVLDDSHSMRMDETGRLLPAKAHGIDLYLFAYGHDFTACLRDYLRLSGKTPPLPRYALGNWWSRFYPYTQESYMELMERFAAEGVPLSVAVLDMNWHVTDIDPKYGPGWTGYTWDYEKFPAPKKLLAWLHERGLRVTLNDHPADGVRACEEQYAAMAKEMGEDPATEKPFPFDAADERYQHAFEKAVLEPFEDDGIDFWWVDWQQKGGTSNPGVDPLFMLNHTRYVHALERDMPAMAFSRYGGPGSHRYPVGFSGDTCATWASLAFQPYFTSTAANIGYSWWSHDIGGHMHGAQDDELSLRWLQFGVFSPIMRLHSSNSRFMHKEPWNYPGDVCRVMKDYLRLRHRLMPWLYAQNIRTSENGEAMLRPVYYDYPGMETVFRGGRNQYLLGDTMMVCPVTEPLDKAANLSRTDAYLPGGEWVDFFTGARMSGRKKVSLYRPLEQIPVFCRAGAIIPMDAQEIPASGDDLPQTVLLRVFPGADGSTQLIEDNGALVGSAGYRRAETRVTLEQGEGIRLTIAPAQGDLDVLPAGRHYIVEMCGFADAQPDKASCGCRARYDAKKRSLFLELDCGAEGAELIWNAVPELPAVDWKEQVDLLLLGANIDFDKKDFISRMCRGCEDSASFLAQLHTFEIPKALYGAMLEIFITK